MLERKIAEANRQTASLQNEKSVLYDLTKTDSKIKELLDKQAKQEEELRLRQEQREREKAELLKVKSELTQQDAKFGQQIDEFNKEKRELNELHQNVAQTRVLYEEQEAELSRIEASLKEVNIPYIILLVSEIFDSQLTLFQNEIDIWVQIACPRISIDWGTFFTKPLITPYEFFVAMKKNRMERSLPHGLLFKQRWRMDKLSP